jgi:hypothetical protein
MSLRRCARAVAVATCLSASTLCPSLWAQGATVETASSEQKKTAQEKFGEGMAAQKKGDHEAALTAFRASYDAVASPNSHLMVARELAELGRSDEAYAEYEKTVAEADAAATTDKKYAQTAKAAKKEYDEARTKIALLIVNVTGGTPGDRVTINGKEIDRSQLGKAMPVMPGPVRIELTTSTGKEVSEEVNAEAGGSPTVTLTVPAAGGEPIRDEGGSEEGVEAKLDKNTSLRTWAYVAGGVGIAGLVTAGVFTILNNGKHSKLEDECKDGICPKSLEEDKDAGETYQTIAQIGLGVGIVGLAAGTVLFILSSDSKEKATSRRERPKPPAPRIDVGVGPRWVSVNGTF